MLVKGTTILGIILASDRTHLTNFTGNKKMHMVYISLDNISKDVQKKHNACAWLLLAKILVAKFSKTLFPGSKTKKEAMPGILQACQPNFGGLIRGVHSWCFCHLIDRYMHVYTCILHNTIARQLYIHACTVTQKTVPMFGCFDLLSDLGKTLKLESCDISHE